MSEQERQEMAESMRKTAEGLNRAARIFQDAAELLREYMLGIDHRLAQLRAELSTGELVIRDPQGQAFARLRRGAGGGELVLLGDKGKELRFSA